MIDLKVTENDKIVYILWTKRKRGRWCTKLVISINNYYHIVQNKNLNNLFSTPFGFQMTSVKNKNSGKNKNVCYKLYNIYHIIISCTKEPHYSDGTISIIFNCLMYEFYFNEPNSFCTIIDNIITKVPTTYVIFCTRISKRQLRCIDR